MNTPIDYRSLIQRAQAETTDYVSVARDGQVASVTLDNPARYNALTPALTFQLHRALRTLSEDPDVHVVILTGTDPAFCAGGDLELIREAQQAIRAGDAGATTAWRWIRRQFGGIVRLLHDSDAHFIAAINGPAAGVGLAFALACDHLIAADSAALVTAFGKIGLLPEVGTSWLLTRRLGYHKTLELFLQGDTVDAERALELGLVNQVTPHAQLLPTAHAWAQRVCSLPDHIPSMAKTQLHKAADMSWEQSLVLEEFAEPLCFTTEDHRRAVRQLQAELARK